MTKGISLPSAPLSHRNLQFERQTLYITGNSYLNCRFRFCTLVVRELPSGAAFENCRFESCIWELSMNVRDRQAWQIFLDQIAPAIMQSLPTS